MTQDKDPKFLSEIKERAAGIEELSSRSAERDRDTLLDYIDVLRETLKQYASPENWIDVRHQEFEMWNGESWPANPEIELVHDPAYADHLEMVKTSHGELVTSAGYFLAQDALLWTPEEGE